MKILGITDGIHGGAALICDGKIAGAVNEERISQKKLAIGFPGESIHEMLRLSRVLPRELDGIAVASQYSYFVPKSREWEGWLQARRGMFQEVFMHLSSFFTGVIGNSRAMERAYYFLKSLKTRGRPKAIRRILAEQYRIKEKTRHYNHHYCHACSAYYTSGLDKAGVFSIDGGGDGASAQVYLGSKGRLSLEDEISAFNSVGNYYAYVTHLCGFKAQRHEGKITGLAAYGKTCYQELLRSFITFENNTIRNTGGVYYYSAIRKLKKALPPDFKREDLAASMQEVLEEIVTKYVRFWVRKLGVKDLALAGGIFANVKLNQRIKDIPEVRSIYVFPEMGDGGLAVGAAYALLAESLSGREAESFSYKPVNCFFGTEYSEDEIAAAVKSSGCAFHLCKNIEKEVALLLAEGKVVARFQGAMEYGPRALGNRSIMYQPTDKSVNDWLNRRLSRTEFMPFAPVVMEEHAEKCFEGLNGADHAARFMTATFDCTPWMAKECPAVVHIDGTARPQIISRDENGGYYRILDEYRKLTGLPCLVNTSFNMHEKPIVRSPEDAITTFKQGGLDALAIGRYLVDPGKALGTDP